MFLVRRSETRSCSVPDSKEGPTWDCSASKVRPFGFPFNTLRTRILGCAVCITREGAMTGCTSPAISSLVKPRYVLILPTFCKARTSLFVTSLAPFPLRRLQVKAAVQHTDIPALDCHNRLQSALTPSLPGP